MFLPETKRDVEDNSAEITDFAKELFMDAVEKAEEENYTVEKCGKVIDDCFTVAQIFYLRAERLHITNLEAFEETEKENEITDEERDITPPIDEGFF